LLQLPLLAVVVALLMALLTLVLLEVLEVVVLFLVAEVREHQDKVTLVVIPTELYLEAVVVAQEPLVRLEQLYKRVLVALV
jgi:hypothetical protein